MSAGPRRNSEAGERDRLIDAFILLSGTGGYAQVTGEEVALRAGLAPSRFERHFPSQLACFNAAWDQLEDTYLQCLDASYTGIRGWRERLRAALAETMALIEANPPAARFMTIEALGAGKPERLRHRDLVARLELLLDCAADGLAREVGQGNVPERAPGWILAIAFDRIYRHLNGGTERRLTADLPELMFFALSPLVGIDAARSELQFPSG